MATGTIILPLEAGVPHSTNPPALALTNSRSWHLLFDDTTPETHYWQFAMPANYASGLTAKVLYSMASATADDVEFEVAIMAVSDGDSADMATDSFDTANAGHATVPGTAGYPDVITVTCTNADSVAAGDFVCVSLARDADDGTNDDATGDAEVHAFWLEYTTS